MTKEKRKAKRLTWKKEASFSTGKHSFKCSIVELSLKNALISTENEIDMHLEDTLTLSIYLTDNLNEYPLKTEAIVKRIVSPDKIAVEFLSLDIESYTTLKDILAYNFGDDSVVSDDLKSNFLKRLKE